MIQPGSSQKSQAGRFKPRTPKLIKWRGAFRDKLLAKLNRLYNSNKSSRFIPAVSSPFRSQASSTSLQEGNLNLNGSTIDLKIAITKAHGLFKDDTMVTTISAKTYSPGSDNIW